MGAALSMNPADLLLSRLEGVQKSGRGWRALCPGCGGKSKKLSVTEADNGAVLLHCFGGCDALGIVEAVGLRLGDLFPVPLRPLTLEERRESKRRMREVAWWAALEMLATESVVVHLAAQEVFNGNPLNEADRNRLALACERVESAAMTLGDREKWRPDFYYQPPVLAQRKRRAAEIMREHCERAEREAVAAEAAVPAEVRP